VTARSFTELLATLKRNRQVYPVSGRKPWLQNHLHHAPNSLSEWEIDMAAVASCTLQALWQRRPLLMHTVCDVLGGPEQFNLYLEDALVPLVQEFIRTRDGEGKLVLSDGEVGRRGIRALCKRIEETLASDVPGLADLARESAMREEVLTMRFAEAETSRKRSWLGWAAPRRVLDNVVPNDKDWIPVARPIVRLKLDEVPPFSAESREGLSALREAMAQPDRVRDVNVILSVGDNPMEEWLLEATPTVDRALRLVDGSRNSAEIRRILEAEGLSEAGKTMADLVECVIIQ
jgi:hypothetical protein